MSPPPTLDIEELERAAGRLLNAQDNLEPDYRWGHAYVHEHKADPHGGDCTDMPWTCSRCVCDDAIREAKAVGAPMLAEITRLREALKAAEGIVAERTDSLDLYGSNRGEIARHRSCLALIRSALGTDGEGK